MKLQDVYELLQWTLLCSLVAFTVLLWNSLTLVSQMLVLLTSIAIFASIGLIYLNSLRGGIIMLLPVTMRTLLLQTSVVDILQSGTYSRFVPEFMSLTWLHLQKHELEMILSRLPEGIREFITRPGLINLFSKRMKSILVETPAIGKSPTLPTPPPRRYASGKLDNVLVRLMISRFIHAIPEPLRAYPSSAPVVLMILTSVVTMLNPRRRKAIPADFMLYLATLIACFLASRGRLTGVVGTLALLSLTVKALAN